MSFALWMILVAIVMPIVAAGMGKWGLKGYDNNKPREWQETLSGWRKRAGWAQQNHFEALPGFAAAVLVASFAKADPVVVNWLAGIFVALRIVYTACYVADKPSLRSLSWILAFACVVGLFIASA